MKRKGIRRKKGLYVHEIIGIACVMLGILGIAILGCSVDAFENLNEWLCDVALFLVSILAGASLLKDSNL